MFLEHVNLTVSDLQRSIDLYSDLLGLHVRWQGTTSDGHPAAHVGDDRCRSETVRLASVRRNLGIHIG